MTFIDINPTTGKQIYKKEFDLAEFTQYVLAIDEVTNIFQLLILLIRIRDIFIESIHA